LLSFAKLKPEAMASSAAPENGSEGRAGNIGSIVHTARGAAKQIRQARAVGYQAPSSTNSLAAYIAGSRLLAANFTTRLCSPTTSGQATE
jgi:hypothetical protein